MNLEGFNEGLPTGENSSFFLLLIPCYSLSFHVKTSYKQSVLSWSVVKVKELIGFVYSTNRIISIEPGKLQFD